MPIILQRQNLRNLLMDDIDTSIDKFLDNYLGAYEKLIKDNEAIIEKCPDMEYPNVDFFFIFPFVERELSHLKSLDYSIMNSDLKNIYSYAKLSITKYIEFNTNLLSSKIVFLNKFTYFNSEFDKIKFFLDKATKAKHYNMTRADIARSKMSELLKVEEEEDFDDKEYKALKKILANALTRMDQAKIDMDIHLKQEEALKEKYFSLFADKYNKRNDKILNTLKEQIGFFVFYTDFLIWENASYGFKIKEFFDFIQVKNTRLSTYMIHHLKHQTSLEHKEKTLIEFRKKLIQLIPIIKEYENKDENKNEDSKIAS